MNVTERIALRWLSRHTGVPEHEIVYSPNSTPDFILPDGSLYEVKRLYGDKIIVYYSQVEALAEIPDTKVVVFSREGVEPVAIIPAGELVEAIRKGQTIWGNVKLLVVDLRGRVMLFIDKGVLASLREYMKAKYGPNSRNISSVFQMAVIELLKREGHPVTPWDTEGGD